jgi:hypothetical protein
MWEGELVSKEKVIVAKNTACLSDWTSVGLLIARMKEEAARSFLIIAG